MRVVSGRCLPYGEGTTYWPVVEVVKQLAGVEVEAHVAQAIRSLLGEDVLTTGEEIAWAFRKLVETAAPLVVVFDDIQWGEETFLDLVEHLALLSSGASILLLCCARPELLDRRPGWPVTLKLEPLPADACDVLLDSRLAGQTIDDDLRDRILRAAGGNPLFVEEMVRCSVARRMRRSSCRRRSRRCLPPGSSSSSPRSAACSSGARSRVRSSTAGRCRPSSPASSA